jgi:hypothetical protein
LEREQRVLRKVLILVGLTPTGGCAQQFAEYFRRESERWMKVLRAAGIRGD